MNKIIIVFLITVIRFVQSATQAHPVEWKEVNFGTGGFSVLLPYEHSLPKFTDSETSITYEGQRISGHKITASDNHIIFIVTYGDLPKSISEKVLAWMNKDLNSPKKDHSVTWERISLDGYHGIEQKTKSSTDMVIMRMFLVKQRSYTIEVAYPKGKPIPDTVYKFFDSFKLISK